MTNEILYFAAATAAATVGGCALYGTFAPCSCVWGNVLWKAPDPSPPWVSLTFDDGPTRGYTDRVLDVLGELKVAATFFVIGQNVAQSPELVRRMHAEGHIVANHTFDHDHLGIFRGPRYWRRQLMQTDELIMRTIGVRPALFRPSMGFTTWPIHHAARRGGQSLVTWSRRGRDGIQFDRPTILRRLLEPARAGDILMLHDGIDPQSRRPTDRSASVDVLGPLIVGLRKRRLTPVRLDQLLGIAAYTEGPADPVGAAAPRPSAASTTA